MFRKLLNSSYLLILLIIVTSGAAWAQSAQGGYEMTAQADQGYRNIAKVKPAPVPTPSAEVTKVKPFGWTSRFEGLSRYNPIAWGPNCFLPAPAKGQFLVGPRIWFARVDGEARRGVDIAGAQTSSVDFDDHLGLRKSGNMIWSIEALYQFRPNWGIRYSFTPLRLRATAAPKSAFNFMGQTFAAGAEVHSKWEHYEHRAGLVFNISRTRNSLTNFFADWLYVQDKLSVGGLTATAPAVIWDDNKSMALLGIEFDKCLKNYRGNTLTLSGKAGLAFFNDVIGYEAEAALNYMIPIKTGRFGFLKGGYRYSQLRKEKPTQMFTTVMDGAFLQFGFLF
jgi:hypothetical protein